MYCFEATLSDTQGLLLGLHLGIILVKLVDHMGYQGFNLGQPCARKCLSYCVISTLPEVCVLNNSKIFIYLVLGED